MRAEFRDRPDLSYLADPNTSLDAVGRSASTAVRRNTLLPFPLFSLTMVSRLEKVHFTELDDAQHGRPWT